MKIVTYRIKLLEPTLVTSLEGDPNSAVSHDYLPGSVLRGTLIGLMMQKHKLKKLDINDVEVHRRFFDNSTRFLNGYVVVDGKRSLPAPRSWEQDKYTESGANKREIIDRALGDDQTSTDAKSSDDKDKASRPKTENLGGKFTSYVEANRVRVKKLQHVINIHTDRDRKRGRSAGNGEGTIYRYDALEMGQTFESQILCENDADADFFKNLLENEAAPAKYRTAVIGGARTAGYGRVQIYDVAVGESAREVGGQLPPVSNTLIVTLLSDLILRDANGQYAPDASNLLATLAKKLGPDVTLDIEKVLVFKNESTIGGFNRKWGLPLPQTQALEMGSVFVIPVTPQSDEAKQNLDQKLRELEQQGIGERRNDGFGRIVINWQQNSKLTEFKDEPALENQAQATPQAEIKLDEVSKQIWERMTKRIERQHSDRIQLEIANKLMIKKKGMPSSQLNRLREVVTTALLETTPGTDKIESFFKSTIKGKRAEKYFENAEVNSKPMKDWVMTEVQNMDKYAALRLIDGMLARAVKEHSKDGESE